MDEETKVHQPVVVRNIEEELKDSYLRYSMSVIISRGTKAISKTYPIRYETVELKSWR